MEKLLVCDALDERDFLRKKISSAINGAKFVGSKRKKDDKLWGIVDVAEFTKTAESTYQSINDLIDRYNRLDAAITLSNATTMVKLRSGKEMTRAAAIALRKTINDNGYDFTSMLISVMTRQTQQTVQEVASYNKKADAELENYKNNLASKDGKLTDEQLEICNKFVEGLYGERIDPINIDAKLEALVEEHDTIVKEIDSAIKVSNATTYVEF